MVAGLSNVRNTAIETEFGVSNWLVAPHGKDASGPAFGGFAGYNSQFENVVLGVEADYTNVHLKGARTDSISRFVIRFPGDHFGWVGLGHQWKLVPVRRSRLSSSVQRRVIVSSRSASVAK